MGRRLFSNLFKYVIILFIQFILQARCLSLNCTFDAELCGWEQEESDDFKWQLRKGGTASANTGPESDHTTGGGYYIYIDATHEKRGDVARITSPMQDPGPYCLTFWYSMYGSNIGALNVYVKSNVGKETVIFTKEKDLRSSDWRNAVISRNTSVQFQIVIEGVRGNGFKGDIAIDDISMTDALCSVDCSFDSGLCHWMQDDTDDFDWTWHKGATEKDHMGPPADHTSGQGYYIYIDTSEAEKHNKARVVSPWQNPGKFCFVFWYYMYGQHVDTLKILKEDEHMIREVTKIAGKQGEIWMQDNAYIASAIRFRIIIEGNVINNKQHSLGDIALDDVQMFSCEDCDDPTPRNGKTYSTNFWYDSTIQITCSSGYYITGNSSIMCQAGGTWSGRPTCKPVDCLTPIIADGIMPGTVTRTTYNQTVKMVCVDRYELLGNAIVTCQSDGNWTTLPTCIMQDSKNNAMVAVYVLVPVAAVAIVITMLFVFWRQKSTKCLSALGAIQEQEKKEQPHSASPFSNATYSGHNNEIQSNPDGVLSEDNEYAIIIDDGNGTGADEKSTCYNTVDPMPTEQEKVNHNYDHAKLAAMQALNDNYTHLSEEKDRFESSYDTTSVTYPGSISFQTDTSSMSKVEDRRNETDEATYEQAVGETPQYFIPEAENGDTLEDGGHYFVLEKEEKRDG